MKSCLWLLAADIFVVVFSLVSNAFNFMVHSALLRRSFEDTTQEKGVQFLNAAMAQSGIERRAPAGARFIRSLCGNLGASPHWAGLRL